MDASVDWRLEVNGQILTQETWYSGGVWIGSPPVSVAGAGAIYATENNTRVRFIPSAQPLTMPQFFGNPTATVYENGIVSVCLMAQAAVITIDASNATDEIALATTTANSPANGTFFLVEQSIDASFTVLFSYECSGEEDWNYFVGLVPQSFGYLTTSVNTNQYNDKILHMTNNSSFHRKFFVVNNSVATYEFFNSTDFAINESVTDKQHLMWNQPLKNFLSVTDGWFNSFVLRAT